MTLTGAAAFAAACGGDDKQTTGTGGGTAQGPATVQTGQAQAAAPKQGGRVKAQTLVDAATLDPHQSSLGSDDFYLWPIYDSLVTYSLKDFSPTPQLAEKWETSPDGATYTFRLRPGLTFHDGTALNAEAVKYNFDRFMAPDFAAPIRASMAPVVDSYAATDATTFQVKLKEPFAPFLSYLYGTAAYRGGQMVSPAAAQRLGKDLTRQPVGAGPFKFKSRVTGTSVEYERFADYWDKGKPYLDGATIRFFSDANVGWEETKSGGNDIGYVLLQDLEQTKKEGKLQVVGGPIPTAIGHLILNAVKPPFNDARARKALSLAMNRKALLDTTQEGQGDVMKSFVPPMDWSYNPKADYFKYDVAEAKRLMSAAGVANGTKVRMIGFAFPPMPGRAEALQAQFREIGLNVEVENGEIAPMVAQLRAGNYDIANFTWDYPGDPQY
ncbi:MAG: ABC transporter substrate-binding protein, partial [Gemmatimonadota bacterium]|nr:ABC transporter substrate-binding protein [Gemmatimonadota bacterium]